MTELKSHENNIAKFEFDVPYDEFKKATDTVYKRNKSRYRVDGFRPGHVSRKVLEKMYGPEIFYDEAIKIVFPKPYEEAVEDVEAELKKQQDENARLVPVEDGEAKEGDTVNIDFDGFLDGERFEGGKAEDYDLVLGSNTFIEGFEGQVAGHTVGDKFDVNVTFPEDYQAKEFQGKDAKFEVEINSITRKELPELDDEFAKDISEFDTLDELKNNLREKLAEDKKDYAKNLIQNQAIEALVKKSEVSAPRPMVDAEIDYELQNLDQRLQQMGITLAQYIEMTKMDINQIRDQYRAQAEARQKPPSKVRQALEISARDFF